MINPIDYETAQGMLQTEAAFTNRPYFLNRRLDNTAAQLAQEQQYSPINYGKIVSADGFEGNVGKFKRPEDTGVSQSDILSWFSKGIENRSDASNDWAEAARVFEQQVNNKAYLTPPRDAGFYNPVQQRAVEDMILSDGNNGFRVRGGEYLFNGGKQTNSSDVGRGSGRHIDYHMAGKLKGSSPLPYMDRFLAPNGRTVKSMVEDGTYVPSSGQGFGTKRKGYSHGGVDIDKRIPELIPNPQYQIKRVIPKHNPNGYGHYVQIEYTDGVTVGLGHLGKENVQAIMQAIKRK